MHRKEEGKAKLYNILYASLEAENITVFMPQNVTLGDIRSREAGIRNQNILIGCLLFSTVSTKIH